MRKATGAVLTCLMIPVAGGVAGCGSSANGTAAAPTPPAARIYARTARALARVHSVTLTTWTAVAHHAPFEHLARAGGPGHLGIVTRGRTATVSVRILHGELYGNITLTGALADNATAEGRPTGAGSWFAVPLPDALRPDLQIADPRRLSACTFPREPAGHLTLLRTGTLDGQATDVLGIRQPRGLGRLTLTAAAQPPYLPLRLTRTRLPAHPHGPIRASGCASLATQALATSRRIAAAQHLRLPYLRVRSTTTTFSGFDTSSVTVPRHARHIPLTPASAAALGGG